MSEERVTGKVEQVIRTLCDSSDDLVVFLQPPPVSAEEVSRIIATCQAERLDDLNQDGYCIHLGIDNARRFQPGCHGQLASPCAEGTRGPPQHASRVAHTPVPRSSTQIALLHPQFPKSRHPISTTAYPAQTVADALVFPFVQYGVPLVLKSDNGSGFKAQDIRTLLEKWRVFLLASPPHTPGYNGACEAGIGSIKRRCHAIASAHGSPGHWSADDIEAARLQANTTSRPRGDNQPTPNEAWQLRQPIHSREREEFARDVAQTMLEVKRTWGYTQDDELDPASRDRVEREALRRVLVARGYLLIRRRRITLPLKKLKAAKNS